MDAMTAQARRFYHHVHHGGSLNESDIAAMVRWMENKDATIARLTAERDEALASAAAAYERAAQWHDEVAAHAQSGIDYSDAVGVPISNRAQLAESVRQHEYSSRAILALDPDATAALAARDKRVREEEIRACAEVCNALVHSKQQRHGYKTAWGAMDCRAAILARLDQPKAESV